MEVGITGDNTYRFRFNKQNTRALAIESKLSNRDTTVNQTNGKRAVSQKDRWARAAFEIGALLYYLSRRWNGSVMPSFGLFERSELRCNEEISCLRLSNRFIPDLVRTEIIWNVFIDTKLKYPFYMIKSCRLSSYSSTWGYIRYFGNLF